MDFEQFANKSFPSRAAAVAPNDGADLPASYVGGILYVGGAGNVVVTTIKGETVTFTGVPVGTILPIQVSRVWLTGTTATAIVVMTF